MHHSTAQSRGQRGVATIEFAICAPLIFLLMLATAEIGRAIFQYNTLVKAVRDGARYLATNASPDGSTHVVNITPARRAEAFNLVVTGNIAGTGTPLLPGLAAGDLRMDITDNRFITVSATYTYRPMLGSTLPMFGLRQDINLARSMPASIVVRALP